MRILFLTEHFAPEVNAAASRVYERACYWVRWGHEVTVLTGAPNFPDGVVFDGYENRARQVETMNGIRVVRVKTFISRNRGFALRTLDFASYMAAAYLAGLVERRPDVVIASSPQFFAAVGGWALAATRGIPFVFELADLWPASIQAVGAMKGGRVLTAFERLELYLYRKAAAVVALTPAFKRDLVRRGIAGEKIAVIPNGVDQSRYQPRPRDAALAAEHGLTGKFVIGYIGTLGMAHDLTNVVDAAALLRHDDRVRVLFVGPGAEREILQERARELGLSNIVFVARQPKEAMPSYWSLCDLALVHLKNHPVFETVIPSKIFEAMGMGVPILMVGPEGEASAIVRRERAGEVVAAADAARLAAAIVDLADHPERVAEMASAARAAAPRYSRERQARDVIAVAQAILDGAPPGAAPGAAS
ncbi:MAG TPA: glycosyltransferase family 4 protein [Kofleriaceae bacterium]|nr:glycosyltransferase family 4 protein [Kofleriaceae bacterium]